MAGDRRLALLTPPGAGGVMVLALQGEDRWQRAGELLRTLEGEPLVPAPGPRLAALWVSGRQVDEVLVVDRPALSQLELHAHGSPAVLAAVEAALGRCARECPTKAQELLWHARGPAQLELALEQLADPLERLLAGGPAGPDRSAALAAAWDRSGPALALASPTRLVLAGAQNAGKSTLMNRLLHRERVLTGSRPGLTRDPVHETTLLAGYPYTLVDTAGEGPAAEAVDRAAQARGRRERRSGLRLLVVDGSRGPDALAEQLMGPDTLVVCNKADRPQAPVVWPSRLTPRVDVSCRDAADAATIRDVVGEALRRLRGLPPAGPVGGPAALDEAQRTALVAALSAAPPADAP
ncbi:MAG: GTPase [Planctomycetota bacterium]